DTVEAIKHLEESTRRDREEILGWLSLSQALTKAGRFDDAETALASARSLDASHPLVGQFGRDIEYWRSSDATP
ncbi:MAG: tetratricopeptide repeat protein, partial [Acidobacteriota bacterium]|nr:tetratricopeptide repeat protein [Acidobacteriota bacterium]